MNRVVRLRTIFVLALATALGAAACAADSASSPSAVSPDASTGTGSGGFSAGTGGISGTGGTTNAGTGGATGVGGATGTGGFLGTGGASTGSGGAGGGGGFSGCSVTIAPVSPPSFAGLESGPDARLRVVATVRNGGSGAPIWKWTVKFQDQSTIETKPIGGDPKVVEFPIAKPGKYDITVQVNTGVVCNGAVFPIPTVMTPNPSLLFRVTPPLTAGFPIPPQDKKVLFTGTGPSTTVLDLVAGTTYSVAPQDQGRIFIPSYVRITGLGSGVTTEGYTANGPINAFLLPSALYDVLVIPDGPIAPMLFSAPSVPANPLVMDSGIPVTGTTRDGGGDPLAGVRIVLRDGARPSTVGVSDATGAFFLWSRAGTLSAVLVPPSTSGLPEAHVSVGTGITLDPTADTLDLQMTWAPITRAALSVTVETSDGSGPIVGANVRVESATESSSVGTLRAQSKSLIANPPVTGLVHADTVTDDAGVARFPQLPVGTYVVTAVPPVSLLASGTMLTTTTIALTASGYSGVLPLVRPVKLSGTLLPTNAAQGTRVTATDKSSGIGSETVAAIADREGAYTLLVAPGLGGRTRHYQLVADPPTGAHLARTVLGTVNVDAVDATAGSLSIAAGVLFVGKVQSGASVLGGAFVQVFCSGPSAACLDPRTPVAETVTQQDGSFSVVVPVPATGQ